MTISAGIRPAARLGEHHGEENKNQNAADVDQDLDRGDKISAEKDVQSRDAHEGAEQRERGINDIA